MNIEMPPPLPQPAKPAVPSPSVQAALQPSAVAMAGTGRNVAAQTVQAAQAPARPDSGSRTRSGTDTGQATDSEANALETRAKAPASGLSPRRGSLLDLQV